MVPSELIRIQDQIVSELRIEKWTALLAALVQQPVKAFPPQYRTELNNLIVETEIAFSKLILEQDKQEILQKWDLNSAINPETLSDINTIVRTNGDSTIFLNNASVFQRVLRIWAKLTAFKEAKETVALFLGHEDVTIKPENGSIDLWILDDPNHSVSKKRFDEILLEIENIQTYCVQIFDGTSEPLTILFVESGSSIKVRLQVAKIVAPFLIGVFTIYFAYIKFEDENGIIQRSNAALAELAVTQKLEELRKEYAIDSSVAKGLETKLIASVESLIEKNSYVEVPQFTAGQQMFLLTPRREMLKLNAPDATHTQEPEKSQ